jgi:hypothetical protein
MAAKKKTTRKPTSAAKLRDLPGKKTVRGGTGGNKEEAKK